MMQMGVTPRECLRAGVRLRRDGSCCKIRRVRGLVPGQLASAKMLCHGCAAKEAQVPSALVMAQKNPHSWAGTHLSSVVLMQKGSGFVSQDLFERSGQSGPGEETQQLHSADKCPETTNRKSTEKTGSLAPSALFFTCRDLGCHAQRDQTSPDNPVIFTFYF